MGNSASRRIMFIVDDGPLGASVKRILERQGYSVLVHDGGPGCCNEVTRFKPDLVLIDVNMPFLSGDAFVHLFRPSPGMCEATIVLYSGIDEVVLKHKALECGAHGYISKLECGLEFSRRIASYLEKKLPEKNFGEMKPR